MGDPKERSRYGKIYDEIPTWITVETPLHVACKNGNYEAVIALVENGVDVDGRIPKNINYNHNGLRDTPLDISAKNLKYKDNPTHLDLVKFLVSHGATRRTGGNALCPVIHGYFQSVNK